MCSSDLAQAYEAEVKGYKAQADVAIATVDIEVKKIQGEVEVYKAQVDKHRSDIQAAVARGEIESKSQAGLVSLFDAEVRRYGVEVDAVVKSYLGQIEEQKARAEISIKDADVNVRAVLGQYELEAGNIQATARVAAQLAASALSAVSATAAIGFSESRGDTRSYAKRLSSSGSVGFSSSWDMTKQDQTNS